MMKIAESSSKRVEDIVGKGEIACYKQFLLFPQCFQKTCTACHVKTRACLGKAQCKNWSGESRSRNCWLPTFSPFPKMFSDLCLIIIIKTNSCVVKDLLFSLQSWV